MNTILKFSLTINDISVEDYITATASKYPVYMPHTAGRYQAKHFGKAQCPIVERLTNSFMMHGWNNGKKLMVVASSNMQWRSFICWLIRTQFKSLLMLSSTGVHWWWWALNWSTCSSIFIFGVTMGPSWHQMLFQYLQILVWPSIFANTERWVSKMLVDHLKY